MAESFPIFVSVGIPEGLDGSDFDRKVLMKGLTDASKGIQKLSKRMLNRRGAPSEDGEIPKRQTGRMWRHVRVKKAKRKNRYWTRVQIDSFEDYRFWYPAPLMYGSSKNNLRPRTDAIWSASAVLETQTTSIIDEAMRKALKGWY